MKRYDEIPVLGLFWWGQFVYWKLDASLFKNRWAVNLCTGVIERFSEHDRVKPQKGMVIMSPPLHRMKPAKRK